MGRRGLLGTRDRRENLALQFFAPPLIEVRVRAGLPACERVSVLRFVAFVIRGAGFVIEPVMNPMVQLAELLRRFLFAEFSVRQRQVSETLLEQGHRAQFGPQMAQQVRCF